MRTGAMAAAVLNSAKVDLGPWDPGRTWCRGHEQNQAVGKGKAGWGPSFFWAGTKIHGEICWLKLFDVVFL